MYLNLYNFDIRLAYTKKELQEKLTLIKSKEANQKTFHDMNLIEDYLAAIENESNQFDSKINDMNTDEEHDVKFKLISKEIKKEIKYGIKPVLQQFSVELRTLPIKYVNSKITHGSSPQEVVKQLQPFLDQQYMKNTFEYTGQYCIRTSDRKINLLKGMIEINK